MRRWRAIGNGIVQPQVARSERFELQYQHISLSRIFRLILVRGTSRGTA
jgi:hypothetical protein